ncbi:MAG: tyrosine-type recombinase/integrase [Bryobacteraceae bacterium]
MSRKRANGEGSIYRRKSDGRWVGSLSVGWTANGRADRVSVYGKTQAEARQKLDEKKKAMSDGLPIRFDNQTVSAFLTRWLNDTVRTTTKPKTYSQYEWAIRCHLNPGLGHHILHKLSPQDFQRFIAAKSESGLAWKSVKIVRDVMRAALNTALQWGLVLRNAAEHSKLAPRPNAERPVFNKQEARAFLDAIRGHRLDALFKLALCLGMRQGEILGLRWEDVDLENRRINLKFALQRVLGTLRLVPTKTRESQRTVPLPGPLLSALIEHRRRQAEERSMAGTAWVESGMVFTTERGTPLDPSHMARSYRAAIRVSGLKYIHFHDLRHSASTILHEAGVPTQAIRKLLGHASARTTEEIYQHATSESEGRLIAAVEEAFGNNPVAVTVAVKGDKVERVQKAN